MSLLNYHLLRICMAITGHKNMHIIQFLSSWALNSTWGKWYINIIQGNVHYNKDMCQELWSIVEEKIHFI